MVKAFYETFISNSVKCIMLNPTDRVWKLWIGELEPVRSLERKRLTCNCKNIGIHCTNLCVECTDETCENLDVVDVEINSNDDNIDEESIEHYDNFDSFKLL